eukprot:gene27175-biopygen17720
MSRGIFATGIKLESKRPIPREDPDREHPP